MPPRRPAADDRAHELALAHYLGVERQDGEITARRQVTHPAAAAPIWPTRGESAAAGGLDRPAFAETLVKARERQRKKRGLKRRYYGTLSYQLQAVKREARHESMATAA